MLALSLLLSAVLVAADAPPATPPVAKDVRRAEARNARPAPEPPPAAPEEAARLLVERKCGKCHDVGRATGSTLSEAEWQAHLRRMGRRPGAAITEEQGKQIHEALKAGPRP